MSDPAEQPQGPAGPEGPARQRLLPQKQRLVLADYVPDMGRIEASLFGAPPAPPRRPSPPPPLPPLDVPGVPRGR